MWSGRLCREGELGSKAEMVWTRYNKRQRRVDQRHYGMKISEDVEW
jgi:hypothetical protein